MTPPQHTGFAVAIDGPVGVGKSTTARKVANRLGMTYIDTGAMYRAVALYNARQGVDARNEAAITASLPYINITLHRQQIFLNGEDISKDIRTQDISEYASVAASYAPVRNKLVAMQKNLAKTGDVVMDGRDIASRVLPWAQVKIYLDANIDIRAQRRAKDLAAKGQPVDFETIRNEVMFRDNRDKTRAVSPLIQTDDAIYVDTGNMTIDEVVEHIVTSHIQPVRRP
ncbi:MAG: (d)CMP kinase [Defluviitaleaceae bacterium]|nr:(d)CMP kinase [Defluviitaleaceae bacterium]